MNNIPDDELEEYSNLVIKNLSMKYFKKSMEYYLEEKVFDEFESEIKKIIKIYCLSYIKIYLKKVAEFIVYNINKNILNFNDIYNILLSKENNKNIYVLKIYLFKCIFNLVNKNYLEFLELIKNEPKISRLLNHDELGNKFAEIEENNNDKHCYNYSLINISNFEYYDYFDKLSDLSDLPLENIKNWIKYDEIINYIKDKNNYLITIELVYNILINKYVFDLIGNNMNNNIINNNLTLKAKSFLDFIEKINISFPENSKKLINFLINRNEFENKIKSKLKLNLNIPLNENLLYILFFAIKIVIIIQAIPNNIYLNFYSNKNDLIKALSENYFPCCFPQNNELIDSYNEIEEHLRNQPPNYGIYMCSCGKYYTVKPCGFPTQTSNCSKCGKIIGGIDHKLERRKGHYRIILDEQAKINIIDRGFDRNMPYKLLSELKKEVDSLLNKPYKGIGKISKEKINKTGYNIRNIKELNFRILNFVIYSHLLISNILGILDNNEISQYFSEETNCFDIMILNWNKMQELISQIGINNIQIFMNIIFERIIKIISKYNINSISNEEGRNKIENEFNNCIFIDEIKNEINIYETQNQKILNSSPFNLSSLIQQL